VDLDASLMWRYVDGFAVGTSHLETQSPCQDRCACSVVSSADGGQVLVAVVSDGAGSAPRSEEGAALVCERLATAAGEAVRASSDLDALSDELVRSWFLDVRDYAATALLAIASDHQALCAQLGDGGIVVRRAQDEPFELAVWPGGGEYANETFFVTDDGAPERIELRRYDRVVDVVAFSDGLQNLALEWSSRSAFGPFFGPLVATVRARADANVRAELLAYLNSEAINRRTDDDKSLAIACRIEAGAA
jgi:hypothetical protein